MIDDAPPPYRTVVFDCDSTLCSIEGVEELASGRLSPADRERLESWTRAAMDGDLALEEVFGLRLELVAPTREELEHLGLRYVEALLPGAQELVDRLRGSGVRVLVISGGLLPAVRAVAEHLGIPGEDVFAVGIDFHPNGSFAGFERSSPLARSGGKLELIRSLGGARSLGPLAWVGDGMTDLEAAPECARFLAFGGVVQRSAVLEAAVVQCLEPNLAALLPWLLGESA